jgi:hypothetical protein
MSFLRKFGIWAISFILSICIFTLIFGMFSHISINEAVGDIYGYADQDTKDKFNGAVSDYCLEYDKAFDQIEGTGITFDEFIEMNSDDPDADAMSQFSKVCDDFRNVKLSKKQFFVNMMDTMMPGGLPEIDTITEHKDSPLADNPISNAYSKIKGVWKVLGISLPVFIIIMFGLLFLFFMHEPKEYLKYIAKMLLRTGIWLIVPFIILLIWTAIHPIDTTPIMLTMLDGLQIDGQSVQNVPDIDEKSIFFTMLPIILKQVYPLGIFLVGIFLILLGVAGILGHKLLKD